MCIMGIVNVNELRLSFLFLIVLIIMYAVIIYALSRVCMEETKRQTDSACVPS